MTVDTTHVYKIKYKSFFINADCYKFFLNVYITIETVVLE